MKTHGKNTLLTLLFFALLLLPEGAFPAGEKAPAFRLKDASGKPYSIVDYRGKNVVFMSFWATWCKPCLLEMPRLEKVFHKYRERGLSLLYINVDTASGQAKARQIAKRKKLTAPVLYDADSKVMGLYNPKGSVPYAVLIDREGRIQYTHRGFQAGDMEQLEREIEKLLDSGEQKDEG